VRAFARYWLPPLGWMALIWVMASDVGSAGHSAGLFVPVMTWLLPRATPDQIALLHTLVRKFGHLTEYAILASLWFRGLVGERRLTPAPSAWIALAVSMTWAVLDEIYQGTVPSRTASAWDVMIDAVGATLAVLAARGRSGNRVRPSDVDPAYPAARPRTG
jgi:VanZ family protein